MTLTGSAPVTRVLLLDGDPQDCAGLRSLLTAAGLAVLPDPATPPESQPDVVLVVLAGDCLNETRITPWTNNRPSPVPVVVFGPSAGGVWRRLALASGAFACLSCDAPWPERLSVVAAAGRYRAALLEIELIRRETEIVVHGLLTSYGEEAEKLRDAASEADRIRDSLDEVRNRIIRSLL